MARWHQRKPVLGISFSFSCILSCLISRNECWLPKFQSIELDLKTELKADKPQRINYEDVYSQALYQGWSSEKLSVFIEA